MASSLLYKHVYIRVGVVYYNIFKVTILVCIFIELELISYSV